MKYELQAAFCAHPPDYEQTSLPVYSPAVAGAMCLGCHEQEGGPATGR